MDSVQVHCEATDFVLSDRSIACDPARATAVESDTTKLPDSGYVTQENSPLSDPVYGEFITHGRIGSKSIKLKRFTVETPSAHSARFRDLRTSLDKCLLDFLKLRNAPTHGPILMNLAMLGTNKANALPCIVLFCSQRISKLVLSFFASEAIKSQLNPPKDTDLPSFRIIIKARAINPLTDGVQISDPGAPVYSDNLTRQFVNGAKVHYKQNECLIETTIGGILELVMDGDIVRRGLTAAHWVCSWDDGSTFEEKNRFQFSVDHKGDVISPVSDWGSCDYLMLEDYSGNFLVNYSEDDEIVWDEDEDITDSNDTVQATLSAFKTPQTFRPELTDDSDNGDIVHVGRLQHFQTALDYALLSFDMVAISNNLDLKLPDDVEHNWAGSRVAIMTRNFMKEYHETQIFQGTGQVSSNMAILNIDRNLPSVKVFEIEQVWDLGIGKGDSGAWVVDLVSRTVIGFLIAKDSLQSYYVMPICPVIRSIQANSHVLEVRLPEPLMPYDDMMDAIDSGYNSKSTSKTTSPRGRLQLFTKAAGLKRSATPE